MGHVFLMIRMSLSFSGRNIPKGRTDRKVYIRDIAPTISTILGFHTPMVVSEILYLK